MSRKDLFVFQRLSPDSFSLANAQIYRNLDLNLTNSNEDDNGLPFTHAADTLHNILASEQDYGKHIRSVRLGAMDDTIELAAGHPGRSDSLLMTRLLWDSKSDSSKLLNTALLLVARKTSKLEAFQSVSAMLFICSMLTSSRWDAPIEISGAVYQVLHKIESLRHLRVRLDVSPSPKMVIRHGLPPNHHSPPGPNNTQIANAFSTYTPYPHPGMASASSGSHPGQSATKFNNVKRKKVGGNGGCNYWANPRMFSGFKHLSTLSLVGISSLDCLAEIAECIKASSATLNSLTLTLSMDLARKARKPATVNPDLEDPSDTELDDDEPLNDPTLPPATTATAQPPPVNEADIRKEKLAQESILATVFNLQSVAVEGKKIEKKLSLWDSNLPEQDSEVISRQFSTLMKSLLDEVASDSSSASGGATLDRFKMIKEVADMFISNQSLQKKAPKEQSKPSALSAKNTGSKSKPLNPLASDFKISDVNVSGFPAASEWDSYIPSPTTSSFDVTSGSSPSTGASKQYPAIGFSTNGPTGFTVPSAPNTSFMSLVEQPVASPSKQISQQKQAPNNAQKLAQLKQLQAHKAQVQQAQQVQAPGYTSPYYGGSYPPPLPSNSILPYPPSLSSTPGIYDPAGGGPYTYSLNTGTTPASTNGLSSGGPPSPSNVTTQAQNGLSSASKKGKAKAAKAKKSLPIKSAVAADSDEEMENAAKVSPGATQPFFAADQPSEPPEDAMDVDMEHPDAEIQELGEDQEMLPEAEEIDVLTPRKRAKIGGLNTKVPVISAYDGQSSTTQAEAATTGEAVTSEEEMQAYIRTTHGLHLDSLALEWVPLKPSIVARALDLSVLKHLTLLEVGTQDALWTLLARLQSASPDIAFKSIHTDNVSQPFVKFLATFDGLEELFMHERPLKPGEEAAASPSVGTVMIRKLALQRHISTLKRLMIRNERNESWDVDTKTMQFLAVKGTQLRELAMSLNLKTYVRHPLIPWYKANKTSMSSCNTSLPSRISTHCISLLFAPRIEMRYFRMKASVSPSTACHTVVT